MTIIIMKEIQNNPKFMPNNLTTEGMLLGEDILGGASGGGLYLMGAGGGGLGGGGSGVSRRIFIGGASLPSLLKLHAKMVARLAQSFAPPRADERIQDTCTCSKVTNPQHMILVGW
jgi:hypothetical protein